MSKKVYIITLLSFIIDQVSKALVSTYFSLNESIKLIDNFLYLNYINNTGASFSILTNKKYLLIVLSLVAIVIIIRYINTFKNTIFNRIGLGLLLGGILGNLSDRILFGYVKDFISLYIFGYSFPVFNIADICIVVGVIILIISILRGEDKNGSSSK